MSEDVSATMRVGITVILVAALVATVLNLMVMSNSLLSGGQTTLQSGIDSVSQQEFASYNNTKVSGTQVNTALSLFQGRDVAIIIQTKTFKTNYNVGTSENGLGRSGKGVYMNYGALLSNSTTKSDPPIGFEADGAGGITTEGNSSRKAISDATLKSASKFTADDNNAMKTIAGSTAGTYYIVEVMDGNATDKYIYQETGAPNLVGLLYDENGVVQTNSNIIGCSTLGNPQYILASARFQSILIKDVTGSIIGIAFYQI